MTKLPFVGKDKHVDKLLDLIHMDVYGPMSMHARDGFIYFITYIDEQS